MANKVCKHVFHGGHGFFKCDKCGLLVAPKDFYESLEQGRKKLEKEIKKFYETK